MLGGGRRAGALQRRAPRAATSSCGIWRVDVGRSVLLLLDARDDANSAADQALTARLYGGDQETRIQQEILLGVGGHRALGVVGVKPSVLHLNEGHSAFALLERARELVEREGVTAGGRPCARWRR